MSAIPGRAAFQSRDFRFAIAAQMLGTIAVQMLGVGVGWLVYDITRDPFALGLVGLAIFLPAVILALLAGHAADHYDRRQILMACYGVAAASAAGLVACAVADVRNVGMIYGLLLLFGVSRAFANPARQALVPPLVPAEHLGNAIAWNSIAWESGTIVGPAVGGLLYTVSGGTGVFATSAGAFLICVALYAALTPRPAKRTPADMSWKNLVAGLSFIRSQPAIFGAISLDLFAVLLGGATALLPVFARDILGTGPWGLGLLRSAPAAGALAMALWLAWRPLQRRAGQRMFIAVAIFGAATVGFGLSRHLLLSIAFLFVLGAADMISVYVRQTLVQFETPDAMRGRVSAVHSVFIGASNELGEFESGTVAAWIGTVPAVVAGGLGTLVVVTLWMRWFPALWQRDRLTT